MDVANLRAPLHHQWIAVKCLEKALVNICFKWLAHHIFFQRLIATGPAWDQNQFESGSDSKAHFGITGSKSSHVTHVGGNGGGKPALPQSKSNQRHTSKQRETISDISLCQKYSKWVLRKQSKPTFTPGNCDKSCSVTVQPTDSLLPTCTVPGSFFLFNPITKAFFSLQPGQDSFFEDSGNSVQALWSVLFRSVLDFASLHSDGRGAKQSLSGDIQTRYRIHRSHVQVRKLSSKLSSHNFAILGILQFTWIYHIAYILYPSKSDQISFFFTPGRS